MTGKADFYSAVQRDGGSVRHDRQHSEDVALCATGHGDRVVTIDRILRNVV